MTSKSSKVHEKTYEIFRDNHYLNRQLIGKKISRLLFDLREKRNDADYNSKMQHVNHNYNFVKARTKRLFKELENLGEDFDIDFDSS